MPSEISAGVRRRRWGDATRTIIEAIQQGFTTLKRISEHTGIDYRSVNAIIHSLEMQDRVIADDYGRKRGLQQFKVMHAERLPTRERGFVTHPRHRRPVDDAWHHLSQLGARQVGGTPTNAGRDEQPDHCT